MLVDDDCGSDLERIIDSDDDATWTPFKGDKSGLGDSAVSRHKRIESDDEDELDYRSVISTPKKPKKQPAAFHSTSLVPPEQDYRPGDFVVLREENNQYTAPIWRFDSKTLLQRFNVAGKDENGKNDFSLLGTRVWKSCFILSGDITYKSANLFSGYIASNRQRYISVAVKFVSNETTKAP